MLAAASRFILADASATALVAPIHGRRRPPRTPRMTTALSATEHLVDRASTQAREQGSGEERKEISDKMMKKKSTLAWMCKRNLSQAHHLQCHIQCLLISSREPCARRSWPALPMLWPEPCGINEADVNAVAEDNVSEAMPCGAT